MRVERKGLTKSRSFLASANLLDAHLDATGISARGVSQRYGYRSRLVCKRCVPEVEEKLSARGSLRLRHRLEL